MPLTPYEAPENTENNNIPGDLQELATWALAQMQTLATQLAAQATPAGAIMAWDAAVAPDTWHVLDGRAISRVDNPVLFARYGTSQGAGNGSTTFNLPNRKGRALVGLDTGQSEFNAIGKIGGAKAHTLTLQELPNVGGQIVAHSSRSSWWDPSGVFSESNQVNGYSFPELSGPETSLSTLEFNLGGGGQAHNNLQPYAVTNWIIKAG